MTDEIKKEEETVCCVCNLIKCEYCKKFLVVALGTFVGMFCAMSLFFALHKPPMMAPAPHFGHGGPRMEHPMGPHGGHHGHRGHHFKSGEKSGRGEFAPRGDFGKNYPSSKPLHEFEE